MPRKYSINNLHITPLGPPEKTLWGYHAGDAIKGTVQAFAVVDTNHSGRNNWEFDIYSADRGSEIMVSATKHPPRAMFTRLARVSFMKGSQKGYAKHYYHPICLQESKVGKTFAMIGEAEILKKKFHDGLRIMKYTSVSKSKSPSQKNKICVIVPGADHEKMIGAFFAEKVWPLKEKFSIKDYR